MPNWKAELLKWKKLMKTGGGEFGHLVVGRELFKEMKIQMQTGKTIQKRLKYEVCLPENKNNLI